MRSSYRRHRNELKEQPSLKAKWDRFIFGTPIETDDFLQGIALCLEWLFDQDMPSSKRRLTDHLRPPNEEGSEGPER